MRAPQDLDGSEDAPPPSPKPPWKRPRVIIVGGFSLLALAFILTRQPSKTQEVDQKEHDLTIGEVVPATPPRAPATTLAALTTPLHMDLPPAAPPPATPPVPAPTSPPPTVPTAPSIDLKNFVRGGGVTTTEAVSRPTSLSFAVHMTPPKAVTPPAEPAETTLDFKTSAIPGLKASKAVDETYMLAPGLLPLVLDSDIQSDLPGALLAHTYGPTYSKTGVILMPAGTQIVGQYESMKQNSGSRLYAVSTFAHVPVSYSKGVWVPLTNQSFTDDLGKSGLDGEVNNHYMQRFGAAILLALGDSALNILQAQASSSNNTYLNFSSGGGGGGGNGSLSGLAQQILQDQIKIPPTFSKHHGELVAIMITEPVDFSSSYVLKVKQ